DIIFANVTFNAVGTAGSSTPLNLHITTLKNTGYNSIPATVINGSFTLESAGIPWDAYLVPSDSTGDYNEDTEVELWVDYDDTGLTYGALAYQFDLHFDPNCVNVTSADFSTSPFGSHMFTPYAPGVVQVLEDNYLTMVPLSSGTYKLATLTLHGECLEDGTSDLLFDPTWCTVSDTDGNPIENRYTNGTYACIGPESDTGGPNTPTPTPTPTPSPSPSLTPTPTPTPPPPSSPAPLPTREVTPLPTPEIPGFESLFACFALLIASLFLLRMRGDLQ
ncbi:MAG: hypothetical protein PHI74_07860, partial [Methanocellales archaeon]|nr:hypothetical protein [Methanocellales archaeon]MDD5485924.1 hypothetical protein [Methanocellales archaeon]